MVDHVQNLGPSDNWSKLECNLVTSTPQES